MTKIRELPDEISHAQPALQNGFNFTKAKALHAEYCKKLLARVCRPQTEICDSCASMMSNKPPKS